MLKKKKKKKKKKIPVMELENRENGNFVQPQGERREFCLLKLCVNIRDHAIFAANFLIFRSHFRI